MSDPILPLESFDNETRSMRLAMDAYEAMLKGVLPCEDTAEWHTDAFVQWVTGKDLNVAFGLPLKCPEKTRFRIQTQHLREALSWVDPDIVGNYPRALALANEIIRFDVNFGDDMPAEPLPDWSRIRRCIWRARQFGKLPQSWERIDKRCR